MLSAALVVEHEGNPRPSISGRSRPVQGSLNLLRHHHRTTCLDAKTSPHVASYSESPRACAHRRTPSVSSRRNRSSLSELWLGSAQSEEWKPSSVQPLDYQLLEMRCALQHFPAPSNRNSETRRRQAIATKISARSPRTKRLKQSTTMTRRGGTRNSIPLSKRSRICLPVQHE